MSFMPVSKLVVGLGNPGPTYANHRHNIGSQCVDLLTKEHGLSLAQRLANARIGWGEIGGIPVAIAKPQTYMNRSGVAVKGLLAALHLLPQDLLVIYDDLDLPQGTIRIRKGGSAGGHNGVQSIIDNLQTNAFGRLRIGIGRPLAKDVVSYVLSPFTLDEQQTIETMLPRALEATVCILTEGITTAMSRYN